MKNTLIYTLLFAFSTTLSGQAITPDISSWILNLDGSTGYGGHATNVQQVRYSNDNVYVNCTCIPGYDIGPWAGNPNTPANQDFCFKITRHPQENTGTKTATPLGHIGTWSNGVSIFNARDGMSYQNQNIWRRDALVFEGASFDNCLGHPAPNGEYHHHVNPTCLYDDTDHTVHSPLIGFAFDGFPIYGTYAFAHPDGTGGLARMESSYRKRDITQRTTLPDGTALPANQYGPDVNATYPIGSFIEDYEYVAGLGDLDAHNGRFGVTPDYPAGIYAYFITLNVAGLPMYPYTLGPTYFGVVQAGNTGPQSGHNVPIEPVVIYNPSSGVMETSASERVLISPNPTADVLHLDFSNMTVLPAQINLVDARGVLLLKQCSPGAQEMLDLRGFPRGMYHLTILATDGKRRYQLVQKI